MGGTGPTENGMDRRAALGLMAATGAGAALVGLPAQATAGQVAAARLEGAFSDPGAARAIGRAYLAGHPEEADADTLLARLCADDPGVAALLSGAEPAAVRGWLRDRCRAEFAAGRTADVSGWRLARSEARVMALLALA